MPPMKRFSLAVLFAALVALLASAPSRAQVQTITLTPTAGAGDQDHGATGEASLADVAYYYSTGDFPSVMYDVYTGHLTVHCEGLTPGATYIVGPYAYYGPLPKKGPDPRYSYVTASAAGSLDLDVQASIWGPSYVWVDDPYGGHWERYCPAGYEFFVARKQGRKAITVLTGFFPIDFLFIPRP